MQALLDVNQSGAYLLMSVGGSAALRRHLAEMGLAIVKKLTVVQPANKATGLVIFFQGQRLVMRLPVYSWCSRLPWMTISLLLRWGS